MSNGAEDKKTVSTQIASNEKKISVVRNSEEVIANSSNTNGEDSKSETNGIDDKMVQTTPDVQNNDTKNTVDDPG